MFGFADNAYEETAFFYDFEEGFWYHTTHEPKTIVSREEHGSEKGFKFEKTAQAFVLADPSKKTYGQLHTHPLSAISKDIPQDLIESIKHDRARRMLLLSEDGAMQQLLFALALPSTEDIGQVLNVTKEVANHGFQSSFQWYIISPFGMTEYALTSKLEQGITPYQLAERALHEDFNFQAICTHGKIEEVCAYATRFLNQANTGIKLGSVII
ncbi:hypothetical protein HZB02_02845 [Candidatus Woesearchaeota archaeon]|nr:hypothetical protein [Candidatus Woesearchaeota archaeon]